MNGLNEREEFSLAAVNAGDNNSGQRLSRVLQGCVEQIQFLQRGQKAKQAKEDIIHNYKA